MRSFDGPSVGLVCSGRRGGPTGLELLHSSHEKGRRSRGCCSVGKVRQERNKKTKINTQKKNTHTNRAYERDPRFYYWTYAVEAEKRMKITMQLMDAVVSGALQQKVACERTEFLLLTRFRLFGSPFPWTGLWE